MKCATKLLTILLVDNEIAIRSLFSLVLQGQGYTVITAADGHEAAELCRYPEEQISLLLTDLAMPRKNGIDLARELRSLWPGLPVIFMSGNRSEWDRSLGTAACMQKPFTPAALLTEVARVLSGRFPRGEMLPVMT